MKVNTGSARHRSADGPDWRQVAATPPVRSGKNQSSVAFLFAGFVVLIDR